MREGSKGLRRACSEGTRILLCTYTLGKAMRTLPLAKRAGKTWSPPPRSISQIVLPCECAHGYPWGSFRPDHARRRLQKLLSLAPEFIRTRLMRRPNHEDESSDSEGSTSSLHKLSSSRSIERWSDSTGRIVLIGESAHPWQVGIPSHGRPDRSSDSFCLSLGVHTAWASH